MFEERRQRARQQRRDAQLRLIARMRKNYNFYFYHRNRLTKSTDRWQAYSHWLADLAFKIESIERRLETLERERKET